jgi:pantoate--beta-alanine ligase
MKILKKVDECRVALQAARNGGATVGFVPTMGALHEGHISLARALREHCDVRVCSIFINPTQFNDPKDYEAYQVNLPKDQEMLEAEGVDFLFAPSVDEIYPRGFQTTVSVSEVSKPFEGALRPGHFTGVASVVTILFNIVKPDVAIFGEKDFQQLTLIEQMTRDLKMDIQIVRGALVRDHDGLALSSRNARLSVAGRAHALRISEGLFAAERAFVEGQRSASVLAGIVRESIEVMPDSHIDYISIVDESSLAEVETVRGACRILVVARVDGVRLLDNIALHAQPLLEVMREGTCPPRRQIEPAAPVFPGHQTAPIE